MVTSDDKLVFAQYDGFLEVRTIFTGKLLLKAADQSGAKLLLEFSKNIMLTASIFSNGAIKFWDISSDTNQEDRCMLAIPTAVPVSNIVIVSSDTIAYSQKNNLILQKIVTEGDGFKEGVAKTIEMPDDDTIPISDIKFVEDKKVLMVCRSNYKVFEGGILYMVDPYNASVLKSWNLGNKTVSFLKTGIMVKYRKLKSRLIRKLHMEFVDLDDNPIKTIRSHESHFGFGDAFADNMFISLTQSKLYLWAYNVSYE